MRIGKHKRMSVTKNSIDEYLVYSMADKFICDANNFKLSP